MLHAHPMVHGSLFTDTGHGMHVNDCFHCPATHSIVRKAERVIGASQPSVDSVYLDLVGGKLEMVWSDTSHPLYG